MSTIQLHFIPLKVLCSISQDETEHRLFSSSRVPPGKGYGISFASIGTFRAIAMKETQLAQIDHNCFSARFESRRSRKGTGFMAVSQNITDLHDARPGISAK